MQNAWVLRGRFLSLDKAGVSVREHSSLGRISEGMSIEPYRRFLGSVSSLFDNGVFRTAKFIQMLMILTPVDCQRLFLILNFISYWTIKEISCPKRRSTSLWQPYFQQCGLPKNTQMSCYKLNLINIILSAMNI